MLIKLANKKIDDFTLYAEGTLKNNYFLKQGSYNEHYLLFDNNYVLALFYTYPHHRRLYLVYKDKTKLLSRTSLPNVLEPVNILYKARGRKIDTLKHFLYLFKNTSNEYLTYPILFYQKLCTMIEVNKKVPKYSVNRLLESFNLGGLLD